jgi:transcriptional regulator with XRE-family HTH domain
MQHRSFLTRIKKLKRKVFRDAYVRAHVNQGLARQIRVLRQQRGWSQAELAKKLNTKQSAVSRLEDPAYGRYTLSMLADLASVFDVSVQVRFASFSKFLAETEDVSPTALEVESFEHEMPRLEAVLSTGTSGFSISSGTNTSSFAPLMQVSATRKANALGIGVQSAGQTIHFQEIPLA